VISTTYRFAAFGVACLSALAVACGGIGSTLSSSGESVHQIAFPDKHDHSPKHDPSPTPTPAPSPSPQPSPTGSPGVQHVVIIIQENRSVDDLFNGFPGADTAQAGQTHDGSTVRLTQRSLAAPGDAEHSHGAWVTDWNSGGMNGFDLRAPQGQPSTYNYEFVPQSETVPYWNLASTYTFADRFFQSNTGPSFPAHLYLISGQSAMAAGNPEISNVPTNPWGCDSPPNAIVQVLTQNGQLTDGPFPCFDFTTLADEMDNAGVSWRYYAPALGTSGDVWSAFDAIRHIRFGGDWNRVISPETQILTDVSSGSLAQVTWVVPSKINSDHAGSKSTSGPQWVASIVNAIGGSQYWNNTVIFVTWDDWGGWYDHVSPPQLDAMGLGFRVPLIVVSPFAKRAYVSHVQHEFGSILKFTEEQFGLPSLGTTDARADDLSDCFNFGQRLERFVPVKTRISPTFFIHQPASGEPPDD
jgi:phospholipase C